MYKTLKETLIEILTIEGGLTSSEIAKKTSKDASQISRCLRSLLKKGILIREKQHRKAVSEINSTFYMQNVYSMNPLYGIGIVTLDNLIARFGAASVARALNTTEDALAQWIQSPYEVNLQLIGATWQMVAHIFDIDPTKLKEVQV